MASTTLEVLIPSGLTATVELYPDGSDTIANGVSGDTLTEATNRKGYYTATVTEALSGWYIVVVKVGSNTIYSGWVYLEDDTNRYQCRDFKADVAGVPIEEASRRIGTITNGTVSGAGSGTETFTPWDGDTDKQVIVTGDVDGNRTGVTHE